MKGLTRRDLAILVGFAPALLFATAPRIDLVVQGSLLYVVLTVLRPSLSLAAVAASLPLYLLPREHETPFAGVTEAALVLAALGIGLRWALERVRRGWPRLVHPRPTMFDLPVALFLGAGLLSLLVTEYLHLSLRELRVVVLEPVLYFYLLAAAIRTEIEARRVVEAFLAAAAFIAVVAVGQSVLGLGATPAEGVQRAVDFFGSPNHLGLFLGRAAPFLVVGVLWYSGVRRWSYGAGALLVAAGLAASFSIGAWLGVGVAVAAIGVVYARAFPHQRRYVVAATAAAVVAVAVATIPLAQVERFAARLDPTEGTTFFRLQLWSASLAMLRDHPLLGVGLDNFLYLYQQVYLPEAAVAEPNLSHPHNLVLDFWLRMGLLGLVAAGWLLVGFYRQAHKLFYAGLDGGALGGAGGQGRPPLRPLLVSALVLGTAASMLHFVVHGSVDNSYFLPDLAYLFWLSLGLIQVLSMRAEPSTSAPGRSSAGSTSPQSRLRS